MNSEFNLLVEPWIRLRKTDCTIEEVSLTDALIHAHDYTALAGESPAQDAAILRLLIAVIHTVFYRVDENGDPLELQNEDDAFDRWVEIWKRKSFPESPILDYLDKWKNRFNLLDENRPFYQTPKASIGTPHTAAKLNGAILQSENKLRIFANRTEATMKTLELPEAARWLVYLQGFDDASVKPKTPEGKKNLKDKPGSARGWLGNLGVIYAEGNNIFETIWLNVSFLKDGTTLYKQPKPCWELEQDRTGEYNLIPVPDNIPELFTLQSRRILLKGKNDTIEEYSEYCGDLIDKTDAFSEPMTVWVPVKKKSAITGYTPRVHSPSRQIWRDFSAIAVSVDDNRRPGIANWLSALQENDCLEYDRLFRFTAVSALYDSSGSSVTNTASDTLTFHADLLTKNGLAWQKRIEEQIHLCDTLAEKLGTLAGELAIAAGKREIENQKTIIPQRMQAGEEAKIQFYYQIDEAFRKWLLLPKSGQTIDEMKELCMQWHDTALKIVRAQGKVLADSAGQAAFIGRWIPIDGGKRQVHYSTAEAFNRFMIDIMRI